MKEEFDKNDPVWELLKRGRKTKPGPFFARNVARAVRNLPAPGRAGDFTALLRRAWIPATAAAAAVIVVALVFLSPPAGEPPATTVKTQNPPAMVDPAPPVEDPAPDALAAELTEEEFEVVQALDDLIAYQDDQLWEEFDRNPILN